MSSTVHVQRARALLQQAAESLREAERCDPSRREDIAGLRGTIEGVVETEGRFYGYGSGRIPTISGILAECE